MMASLKREPAFLMGLIQATLALLVAFGVGKLDGKEVAAINAFAAALLSLVARQLVTPISDPRMQDGSPAKLVLKT